MPTPVFRADSRKRVAGCLLAYIDQMDRLHPNRSYASDGTVGDLAHQASSSRHNPMTVSWSTLPVIFAADITHDPARGCDNHVYAERLRRECRAGRETRLQVLIWNRRYCSRNTNWEWRPYSGSNPHDKHMHVEARYDIGTRADDRTPFKIGGSSVAEWTQDQINGVYWEGRPWAGAAAQNSGAALAALQRIEPKIVAIATALDALLALVNAGGGNIDTAALLAKMDEVEAADRTRDEQHAAAIAELNAENDRLRQAVAAAGQAFGQADGNG